MGDPGVAVNEINKWRAPSQQRFGCCCCSARPCCLESGVQR